MKRLRRKNWEGICFAMFTKMESTEVKIQRIEQHDEGQRVKKDQGTTQHAVEQHVEEQRTKNEQGPIRHAVERKLPIPPGTNISVSDEEVKIEEGGKVIVRKFPSALIEIRVEGGEVKIIAKNKSALSRATAGAFESHIKNAINGLKRPYIYKVKAVFSHFPISLKLNQGYLEVSNYLGGRGIYKYKVPLGADVKVEKDLVTISSIDKELAGTVAGAMERIVSAKGRDKRVFQDGLYIVDTPKSQE